MWGLEVVTLYIKSVAGFCERICLERLYVYCLNIDIWRQHIDNVPQDEISRYVVVSIFWHTPSS